MDRLSTGWLLARHRIRAHWRLLLAATLGVLLASTLLAAVPVYADAMSDLGLRFRLDRGLRQIADRVVYLELENSQAGDRSEATRRADLDAVTAARIGWLAPAALREDQSERVQATLARSPAAPWPAFVLAISDLETGIDVTSGRLPAAGTAAEVVLPDGYQRYAAAGESIQIAAPTLDDCQRIPQSQDPDVAAAEVRCKPSLTAATSMTATVVGFVRQRAASDPRWQFFDASWATPDAPNARATDPGSGALLLLTSSEQYSKLIAERLPTLRARHRSGIVPDLSALRVRDVPSAIADLAAWKDDVRTTLAFTAPGRLDLADQLAVYRNAQTFSRAPLLLILLQVVGVIAFYVVLIAALIADRQANEFSVYRSRGASSGQLLALAAFEAMLLAIPAAILGPWLAARAVALLGHMAVFARSTHGAALPVSIPSEAYLLAAAGALLSVVAMLIPAWAAARRNVLDERRERARPRGRGFIQRYYLDVAIVALAALQFWQLARRGTVFDAGSVGGWASDPLLLTFPLVLTLAAAALTLRLYSPLLRLVARLARPMRGAVAAVGLRQTAGASGAHARLLLLLIMAASVATFAASYGPTSARSFRERALYASGVDLRAQLDAPNSDLPQQFAALRTTPGVADAVLAYRGALKATTGNIGLLGVGDLDRVPAMLWWRHDFAKQSLRALLGQIQPQAGTPPSGIPVPAGATDLELYAYLDSQAPLHGLAARVRDASGAYFELPYLEVRPKSWQPLSAPIPSDAKQPVSVVAFRLQDDSFIRSEGSLFMDDLAAIDASGKRTLLEDFEVASGWETFTQAGTPETFEASLLHAHGGARAGRWHWDTSYSQRESVLAAPNPAGPPAAILSTRALALFHARVGDTVSMTLENGLQVPLHVTTTAVGFPTLDPGNGFIVVDRGALRDLEGTAGIAVGPFATELWARFDDSLPLADQQALVAKLTAPHSALVPLQTKNLLHQDAMLDEAASDPTLVAAGSGILFLAAIAVLLAAGTGFAVTTLLAIGARSTEFAVLHALGLEPRQVLRSLLLEWGTIAAAGALLGVVLGRLIARVMLSSLDVTSAGERVVPAFTMQSDWVVVGLGLAAVAALAAAALVLAWRAATQRATAAELRQTQ